jgi:hypothetical protein
MFTGDKLERAVTAAIALILILGMLGISIYQVATGNKTAIPDWLYSSAMLVIGYYFGNHKGQNTPSPIPPQNGVKDTGGVKHGTP